MKIYQSTYLLVTLMLMVSCEPLPFDTTDDEPVFTTTFTLGEEEFNFDAGVDDYVMAAEVLGVSSILTKYSGTLEHRDNPTDNPQFRINFSVSEKAKNSDSPDHFESFKVGDSPYFTWDDVVLPLPEVSFDADYDGTGIIANYTWEYGDDQTVAFKNPIHEYPSSTESYVAQVQVEDDNQCIATAQSLVTFDNRSDCTAKVEVVSIGASSAVLEAGPLGSEPVTYQWFDGSTDSDISINIGDTNENQSYCVTVTNTNGCSSVNCVGIIKDAIGDVNNCSVTMSERNVNRAKGAIQFDAVDVEYINNAQIVSDRLEVNSRELIQDSDAYFRILSFEEFEINSRGERTVKFDFELKCTMYQTLGTDPVPLEASGTMAVAIPN